MDLKDKHPTNPHTSFAAQVKLAGINPYVDVPEHVVKAPGPETKTAVLVKVAAAEPPKKVSPGREKLVFEMDAARLERIGRLAPGAGSAQRSSPGTPNRHGCTCIPGCAKRLASAWDALTPSRQREILSYLNFLKTPEALERNVHKTIAKLLQRQESDCT